VGEHRVLTTGQLAALGFDSVITARHRLTVLAEVGALRRFRPHRAVGSAPWHYLLGPVGAALLGAEDRDNRKWVTAVRAGRQLALEHSQRLAHLLGVNWFFAALAAHARQADSDCGLRVWLNETDAHEWLFEQVLATYDHRDLPNPDGLGTWAQDGLKVTFLLEYDNGSEHLPQLTGKLGGYGGLAKAMATSGHVCPLLLFCFPTPRREQAARRALAARHDASAMRIATTAINPEHTSPAGPVWLPLGHVGNSGGQMALSALGAALSDPWAQYRADRNRRASRQHRPAKPWQGTGRTTTKQARPLLMTLESSRRDPTLRGRRCARPRPRRRLNAIVDALPALALIAGAGSFTAEHQVPRGVHPDPQQECP